MSLLRTSLVLGRVSNLPTVWSNCLAGWWLGGGENNEALPLLFLGTTLLYTGGMYLNDAFDVEFDRQHRPERPLAGGEISLRSVWRIGLLCLAMGAGCLFCLGPLTGGLALALACCIVLYDAIHKLITFSPVLMGVCRFFVYVVAASVAKDGVTGWAIWGGLALAVYIVGLSYLARKESARGPLRHWPLLFLGTPVILALLMNANGYRETAFLLSAILALWVIRCLRTVFQPSERNIGRTVTGLLAGIVLVDLLAAADAPQDLSLVFLLLFGATLLFQRFIPAT